MFLFLLLFSDSSPHFPPQDIFSVCFFSAWRFFSTCRFTDISIASLLLQCWSGLDCLGQFLFTLRVSSMGTISPSLPSWFCIYCRICVILESFGECSQCGTVTSKNIAATAGSEACLLRGLAAILPSCHHSSLLTNYLKISSHNTKHKCSFTSCWQW